MTQRRILRIAAMICNALACGVMACLVMVWPSPASAQTFQSYICADGSQFSTGFFQSDTRAFVQIDGRPVTLSRRVAVSGRRYAGSGVTLVFTRAGLVTLRHAKRPATVCRES